MINRGRRFSLVLAATWLLCLALAAAAAAEAGLANPWEETTAEALAQFPSVTFGVPEGAEDIEYRLLREDALAEMQFTWYDLCYCARISPAAEFADISGLYWDWTHEMPCRIGWCDGVDRRCIGEDETVDVCLWYDAVSGLMYSVGAVQDFL